MKRILANEATRNKKIDGCEDTHTQNDAYAMGHGFRPVILGMALKLMAIYGHKNEYKDTLGISIQKHFLCDFFR